MASQRWHDLKDLRISNNLYVANFQCGLLMIYLYYYHRGSVQPTTAIHATKINTIHYIPGILNIYIYLHKGPHNPTLHSIYNNLHITEL